MQNLDYLSHRPIAESDRKGHKSAGPYSRPGSSGSQNNIKIATVYKKLFEIRRRKISLTFFPSNILLKCSNMGDNYPNYRKGFRIKCQKTAHPIKHGTSYIY